MLTTLLITILISSILNTLVNFEVATKEYNPDNFLLILTETVIPFGLILYIIAFAVNHT